MRSLLVLLMFCVVAPTASFALVFGGYIKSADEMRFVLIDDKSRTSEFVRLGDSFQGHRVLKFDAVTDTLTVQQTDSGEVIHLKLKGSSVKDSHWHQNGTVLTILVRPDGSITQNGHPVPPDLLTEKFRQAAVDGWLHLRVTFPPGSSKDLIIQTLRMLRPPYRTADVLGRFILEPPAK